MPRRAPDALRERIDAIRRFNRFYTRLIGALDEGHLDSDYGLADVRVLYELAQRGGVTATELATDLHLDAGYLSRILRGFSDARLVAKTSSVDDGRRSDLRLTAAGRRVFADLDRRARDAIAAVVEPLAEPAQRELVRAMIAIEASLTGAPPGPIVLRDHRPGDMGWIVSRQAVLYATEYGWSRDYEALTARIVADFLDNFDPARDQCWVADRAGEIVGSVFVVRHPDRPGVAKLRMLYVEASARGTGLGRQLVHECSVFARGAGYHTLTLWTNSVLVSARRIYEAEGYRLVDEQPQHIFGKDLVSQTWELALDVA